MFNNLTIKTKIITLMVVSLSLLTIVIAIFSVSKAKDNLVSQNYAMLTSARDSKIIQITDFFNKKIADINVLSRSANIIELIEDLELAAENIKFDVKGDYPINNIFVQRSTKMHEEYLQNYMKDYNYDYTNKVNISGIKEHLEKLANELISDVASASREQEVGIIQINDVVTSLDQQTQKNASVSNETKDIALRASSLAKGIVDNANEKVFEGKDNIDITSELSL